MAAADIFKAFFPSLESPAQSAFPIIPNDSADLPRITRAIFVGTAGDVNVVMQDDSTPVLYKNVAAGYPFSIRIKKMFDSGTSASDIVGML